MIPPALTDPPPGDDGGLVVGPVLGGKAEPAVVDDLLAEDPIGSCGAYRVEPELWPGGPGDPGIPGDQR